MRVLSLSVPDALAGEAQPHLASLLNMSALATIFSDGGGDAGRVKPAREAAALLRESIAICPPESPASHHLVTCMGGLQATLYTRNPETLTIHHHHSTLTHRT